MSKQNLTVGVITATDPNDKRSWSGSHYYSNKALKDQFTSVINLGPVKLGKLNYLLMHVQLQIGGVIHKYLLGGTFNKRHNHIRSRYHARFFDKAIRHHKIDVLYAPAASIQIAHLKTTIPICYYSDATVAVMLDYYENFSHFSKRSKRISNEIEQMAIRKATTQVFSSQWSLNSAINDYGAKHPFLVKMGANIDEAPKIEELIKQYDSTISIVFVGVNWQRKGGDIVLDTIDLLCQEGYDVHLTVMGCVPPKTHPNMTVIPFLNKSKKDELQQFQDILKKAHLFFMPTRADCTPISFCEANAYGLPVITTETGGVPSVIENGVNGFLLPYNAGGPEYAQLIAGLVSDKNKLKELVITSREKYEKELNWGRWGKEMEPILLETVELARTK